MPGRGVAERRAHLVGQSRWDLADTQANEQRFGRPGSARGEKLAAFPQLRMVGLAECGTHAMFDVAIGPLADDERTLAGRVLRALTPGMLCLADRGFYSFELWKQAANTGAQLLWRTKSSHKLAVLERLAETGFVGSSVLGGRTIIEGLVGALVVEPGDPFDDRQLQLCTAGCRGCRRGDLPRGWAGAAIAVCVSVVPPL